jgi:hypothetical protein
VSFKGTVKNGMVVLPSDAKLPDGAKVEVIPLQEQADDPPFLRAILNLAKPRDWPEDFALNHAHYIKGHPGRHGGSSL